MKLSSLMLAETPSGDSARISHTVFMVAGRPSLMLRAARPTNLESGFKHARSKTPLHPLEPVELAALPAAVQQQVVEVHLGVLQVSG